jgi:hypothetical protein
VSGELVVAIFALVVSMASFEWNRRAARSALHSAEATAESARLTAEGADRHARMPVLSPYFDERYRGVLFIRSVGNGPAVNIMLADGKPILTETDLREVPPALFAVADNWHKHWHLRPIPPNAERRYRWTYKNALGLAYTDALGVPYRLVTTPHGTRIIDGAVMPTKTAGNRRRPRAAPGRRRTGMVDLDAVGNARHLSSRQFLIGARSRVKGAVTLC